MKTTSKEGVKMFGKKKRSEKQATPTLKLDDIAISRRVTVTELAKVGKAIEGLNDTVKHMILANQGRYWDAIAQQFGFEDLKAVQENGLELFVDDGLLEARLLTKEEAIIIHEEIEKAEQERNAVETDETVSNGKQPQNAPELREKEELN